MGHPKPYPRCVFCDAKADSREHAIPAWIARRFGLRGLRLNEVEFINLEPRKQPISVASYRARIFCKHCNKHFKHLEDAAIPYLVPMGKARSIALGDEAQATLALWGAKTAYALLAAGGLADSIPAEHLRLVRYEDRVPDDCWVGYTPWSGRFHKGIGEVDLEDRVNPPARYQAYQALLAFASVSLKVLGLVESVPRHAIDGERLSVKQVWPKQAPLLVWPPAGEPATDANLPDLVRFVPLRPV